MAGNYNESDINEEEYDLEEETMASSSLKPGARKISDPTPIWCEFSLN